MGMRTSTIALTRRHAALAVLGTPLAAVFACTRPGGSEAPQSQAEGEKATVVIAPPATNLEGFSANYQRMKPITEYLSRQAGITFETWSPTDYASTMQELARTKLDAAWLPPLLYARSHEDGVATAALKMLKKDAAGRLSETEQAVILVRADGPQTLAELKGKIIAATDPADATGWLFPAERLAKDGVNPLKDARVDYRSTPQATLVRLLQQRADGTYGADAAFSSEAAFDHPDVLKVNKEPRQAVRILAHIENIPLDLIVLRRALHPKTADKVRAALQALTDTSAAVTQDQGQARYLLAVFGYDGAQEAKDGEYARVKEAAKTLGMPLKTK
jgi:phosphonate transport system substrate-binding protein